MRRNRRNRSIVFAGLCWGVAAAQAGTLCPPLTRVGVSDLGYTSYRENGRISGIAIDLINEMAHRTGCKFEFVWYPRQRLFVELEAGRIDMAMGSLRTPERDVYASYLPYAYLQYDLILRASAQRRYASLGDFVARGTERLNVTRGIIYDTAVETQLALLASAGRLEVVNDFETVFGKLQMGRADGTLATPPIYGRYFKQHRMHGWSVIPMPEATPRFTGIYVSRKTVPVAARLHYATALKGMVGEQYVVGLYGRYFDDATVKRTFRQGAAPLTTALTAAD